MRGSRDQSLDATVAAPATADAALSATLDVSTGGLDATLASDDGVDGVGVGASAPVAQATGRRRGRAAAELAPGERVGRYEVVRLLGRGAMGAVYAAYDPALDRDVALKVLHGHAADATARLAREAQGLAKLNHPGVVTVYDSGEHEGRLYLAMELVDGTTLDDFLATRRPTLARRLELFVAAGRGLAAAHDAGLVHRDFKPANTLVDRQGRVAVTDFGLVAVEGTGATTPSPAGPADAVADLVRTAPSVVVTGVATPRPGGHLQSTERRSAFQQVKLTRVGAMVGTPAYMAPEQQLGRAALPASDQFAFAVALWEALFNRHPLIPDEVAQTGNVLACCVAMQEAVLIAPPPNHGVASHVERALRRALALDPAARWPSMHALLDTLAPAPRPSRLPWIAAGVAVLALGTVGALVLTRSRAAAPPSCVAISQERVATVWQPTLAQDLRDRWQASGVPYAVAEAKATEAAFTRFADEWTQHATASCLATRRQEATTPQPTPALTATANCLDQTLESAGRTRAYLTSEAATIVLPNVRALRDHLPSPAACALADQPPAGVAPATIARLRGELERGELDLELGRHAAVEAALTTLGPAIADVNWPRLTVRERLLRTELDLRRWRGRVTDALATAALATEHGLDHTAARAWMQVIRLAGRERNPALVSAATTASLAIARKREDLDMEIAVLALGGTALNQAGDPAAGLAQCQRATEDPRLAALAPTHFDLDNCLLSTQLRLDRHAETSVVIDRAMAARLTAFGAEHPSLVVMLVARADRALRAGDEAAAERDLQHARRIAEMTYPASAPERLQLQLRAISVYTGLGQPARADAEAKAIIAATQDGDAMVAQMRSQALLHLANAASTAKPPDFTTGTQLARAGQATMVAAFGDDNLMTAITKINTGQLIASSHFDEGARILEEAIATLDRLGDYRAVVARASLGLAYSNEERPADALRHFDAALANNLDSWEPYNRALIRFKAAELVLAERNDVARAGTLAEAGLADLEGFDDDASTSLRERLRKLLKEAQAKAKKAAAKPPSRRR